VTAVLRARPPTDLAPPLGRTSHESRIPQLDGLRALAISAVYVHHAFHLPLLWAGVDLFFVLSGFLITGILLREKRTPLEGLKHFYARRALRILPPYGMALLVTQIAVGIFWKTDWPWLTSFASNIGLAFGKMKTAALVPLWSLAVEEQFYLVWPWLLLWTTRRTVRIGAFACLLLAPCLRFLLTPAFSTEFPIYFLTPFRMDLLAAGAMLALSNDLERKRWRFQAPVAVAIGIAVLGTLALFGYRTGGNSRIFNTFGYEGILFVCVGFLAWSLTLKDGFALSCLSARPLRYLGQISYFAYLIHLPLLLAIRNPWLAMVAVIFLSAASWELVEKRLLAWGRS
jgi:peptidoglycan/LPS O-acetylase OafA/YrhL